MKKEIISAVMSELGSRKSEKKAESSRKNGKKGGRPTYKFSVLYSRGQVGSPGKTIEIITEASSERAAINHVKDEFDDFGTSIPKSKFKWSGNMLYAYSGSWEESLEASKWEDE